MIDSTFQTALRCLFKDDVDQISTLVRCCPELATKIFANKFGHPVTLMGELLNSYHMSSSNKLAVLEILFELGAEPDPPQAISKKTDFGKRDFWLTPLAIALERSDVDIVARLRAAGASFDYVYQTLTYRYLIGIDSECTKFRGRPNRHTDVCLEQLDYLQSIGFDLRSWEQSQAQSFLQHVIEALHEESLDVVERLLACALNIDGNVGSKSALKTAFRKDYYRTALMLIKRGASLERWYQSIEVPVAHHLACCHNAMPKRLLTAATSGQNLSAMHCTDESIITALHLCVSHDNLSMLPWLVANGANIDATATDLSGDAQPSEFETGDTPIFTAIRNKNREAIELLIKLGARLDVCNARGDSPLDVAHNQKRFKTVAKLLEKAGAIACRKTDSKNISLPDRSDLLLLLDSGEPWSDAALGFFSSLEVKDASRWHAFLMHCIEHKLTAPNDKWITTAETLMEQIGDDQLQARILSWLKLVPEKRTDLNLEYEQFSSEVYFNLHSYSCRPTDQMITVKNTRMLIGLLWCASRFGNDEAASQLATIARSMYLKVRNVGMRNAKVANAATNALTLMGENGLRQLIQLTRLLKYNPALTNLHRILDKAVKVQGIDYESLDRLAAPNLPVDNDGTHSRRIGDSSAIISFPTVSKANIEWLREDGKRQKSVPASVKKEKSSELAELKDYKKQLIEALRSEQRRVERSWLTGQTWSMDEWQAEFIDPKSVGRVLVRRLIWTLTHKGKSHSVIPTMKGWVDYKGDPFEACSKYTIQLWHPADAENVNEVEGWKHHILTERITQPFAQAHREVYNLTDTERHESGAIQRFSGQIVRHHQFHALAQQRGWSHTLHGNWDGGRETEARLYIASANIMVELSTRPIETAINAHGIWEFLVAGELRIYGSDDRDQSDLESIPRRLFSEILRDVDLLVSVPNAGRTPDWESLGIDERYRAAWGQFANGQLGRSGTERRAALEEILPSLPFADNCLLSDRYLLVTGSLGEYRVHLGSGNVTMANGNRSLVISSTTDGWQNIFTPFEGDRTLSEILSKAQMLAADGKIKNRNILDQIQNAA